MNFGLKMEFEKEKEKKETSTGHPFSPGGPSGPSSHPATAHFPSSPFSFFPAALTTGARLSASPSPLSFHLPPVAYQSWRRHAIPTAPGRLPTFLSSPRSQLRQSSTP
jgi:hypothetical protein